MCLTSEEKAWKKLRVVEKCPDIPVTAVQNTFTHKQNTEYRDRNIHNKKKKKSEMRAVPRLCELYPGICLTNEGKSDLYLFILTSNNNTSSHG
jgi:hypothetical protein